MTVTETFRTRAWNLPRHCCHGGKSEAPRAGGTRCPTVGRVISGGSHHHLRRVEVAHCPNSQSDAASQPKLEACRPKVRLDGLVGLFQPRADPLVRLAPCQFPQNGPLSIGEFCPRFAHGADTRIFAAPGSGRWRRAISSNAKRSFAMCQFLTGRNSQTVTASTRPATSPSSSRSLLYRRVC